MIKTMMKAAVAMTLLAGCGDTMLRGSGEAPAVEETVTRSAQALKVDLRMRGVGAEGYANVLLVPGSIEVKADGVALPVVLDKDLVDLAQMEQAFKLASIEVPEGARQVEFTVRLAPAGGFESATASGWIDTRSTTLSFVSSVENLAKKNKAVIELDATRSLIVRDDTTLALVPKYRVEY